VDVAFVQFRANDGGLQSIMEDGRPRALPGFLVLLRSLIALVTGNPFPPPRRGSAGYGVDVPAMSLELHEWDMGAFPLE
jgi:hypothetical protein